MVLLVEKFVKLYSKLQNRRHQHDLPQLEELSSSLHAFKSHVSKFIGELALHSNRPEGSEILSLSWVGRCFGLLPMINKAFAKLVVDIDYQMSKWEVDSIEAYLNYTLSLLELLNSMSSSLSHLRHARLSLAHGLSLVENNSPSLATKHILKAIKPVGCLRTEVWSRDNGLVHDNMANYCLNLSGKSRPHLSVSKYLNMITSSEKIPVGNQKKLAGCFRTDSGKEFYKEDDKAIKGLSGNKEAVVHEAVREMKSVGLWVRGVLLSCLYNDYKPYMEQREFVDGFDNSPIFSLDLKISEQLLVEKMPILSEVEQLNIAVGDLVDSDLVRHDDAAKEVQRKQHDFVTILDDISKGVDDLFANVMTQRCELIHYFQLKKQPPRKSMV